jgi:hypothetical protein
MKKSKRKVNSKSKRRLDNKFGHAAPWCGCGCGEEVRKGSRFKQGHDARLRPNSRWRREHPELFGVVGGGR